MIPQIFIDFSLAQSRLPSSHPNQKTPQLLPGIPSPGNPLGTAKYLIERHILVRNKQ